MAISIVGGNGYHSTGTLGVPAPISDQKESESSDLKMFFKKPEVFLSLEETPFFHDLGSANGKSVQAPESLSQLKLPFNCPCYVRSEDRHILAIHHSLGKFYRVSKPKPRESGKLGPTNDEQAFAWHLLNDQQIKLLILHGPAGVGKSLLVLLHAIANIDRYDHIYLVKQACVIGEKLGFLPGELEQKFAPFEDSFRDNLQIISEQYPRVFDLLMGTSIQDDVKEDPRVMLCPLSHLRGRKLHRSLIVLDEGQNTDYQEAYTVITRAGDEEARVIVMGDLDQIDYSPGRSLERNGLLSLLEDFSEDDFFAQVGMLQNEQSRMCAAATKHLAARHKLLNMNR